MNKKQVLLIGCGVPVLLVFAAVVALVAWLVWAAQDPPGVVVSAESPSAVAVGEEFTLTIVVENQREDDEVGLTTIDLADEYIENFVVVATDPPAHSSMHVPIDNTLSYEFNVEIPAQSSRRFEFVLRAVSPGLFRGDADICEGVRFTSTLLQIEVTPAGDGP